MPPLNEDQFVQQIVHHQAAIYRFIAGLLPGAADVEDAFQETTLVLWRERQQYDPDRPFKPWAFAIARNIIRNHLRKSRQFAFGSDLLEQLIAERSEAEEDLSGRREALSRCIDRLSAADRDLVRRCYGGTERIQRVAASTGRTPNAVYLQLRRIRHVLLDCVTAALGREAAP
jgi:RNA polymerase sigma-70 factor (ECF subfamily)